ncbi:MAG: AraC family transcriptional regulator [Eubacteriales bacterium]
MLARRTRPPRVFCGGGHSGRGVQIAPSFCNAYYPELKQTRFIERHFNNGNNKNVWDNIYSNIVVLMNSLYKREDGYRFEIMGVINIVFYHLFHSIQYEKVTEERWVTQSRNMNRLNRIIGYMQENYTNKISLAGLAEKEELDLYYLSHFIKKYLGMSFQQYLNKLRLDRALELIMRTDKKNIDICFESGFSDYRYLCKAFESEYRCTPSQYKARHKDKYILDNKDYRYEGSLNTDNDQYIMLNQEDTFKKFFDYLSKKRL